MARIHDAVSKASHLNELDVLFFGFLLLLDASIVMIGLWFQCHSHTPIIRHQLWPFWANLTKNLRIGINVWIGALSWCKIYDWFLHNSVHFERIALRNLLITSKQYSLLTVLPCGRNSINRYFLISWVTYFWFSHFFPVILAQISAIFDCHFVFDR